MMWGYGFGWGWLMMSLGTILWIAILVVLIRWLNNRTSTQVPPPPSGMQGGPTALEILQQRYARGEIDTATYEQMYERLQTSDPRRSQYENQSTTSIR